MTLSSHRAPPAHKEGQMTSNTACTSGSVCTLSVELLRFLAALGIMFFHFGEVYLHNVVLAPFAYVFVELFLILTGFLMMKHLESRGDEARDPFSFLTHKAASFFAPFIVVFSIQFILFVLNNTIKSPVDYLSSLFHFKWEALLLHCSGSLKDPAFGRDYLLGQDWYFSAMMLGLIFVYPIARYYRRFFTSFFAPAASIMFYAILVQKYGKLDVGTEYLGIISTAIIRSIAGICFGSLCYSAYKRIMDMKLSRGAVAGISVLEVLLWLAVLALLGPSRFAKDADVPIYLIVFSTILVFAFSDRFALSGFLNHHGGALLKYLGGLSLYMFIVHWTVMSVFMRWWPGQAADIAMPVFCAASIACAALLMWVDKKRKTLWPVAVTVGAALCAALFCALCIN